MIYTESNVSRESFIDINNSFWVGNTSLSKDKGYPEELLDLGYAFLPSLEDSLTGSGTGTFTLTASASGLAVEIGTPSAESFILSSTAAFSGTVLHGDGTGTFTLTGSSNQIGVFLGVSTANTFTLSGSGAGILLGSGSGSGSGTFTLSATSVPAVGVHKGDGTGSFTLGLTSTPTLSLTLRYVLTRMNEEADPMSIRLTVADIDSTVSIGDLTLLNNSGTTVTIGTPVYIDASESVDLALASDIITKDVIGLIVDTSISAASSGSVRPYGSLTASTGAWDSITGDTGGLTVGASYYLDPYTAGKMTATIPDFGFYVVYLGKALSTTKFMIQIEQRGRR